MKKVVIWLIVGLLAVPPSKMPDNFFNAMFVLCDKLDKLYHYAIELIPKDVTHSLGFKKEQYKDLIQKTLLALRECEKVELL